MATGIRVRPTNIQRDEEIQMTPIPGGEITSTETWGLNGNDNQTVEEATQESLPEETNATESEVVEGGSETEG